MFDLLKGSKIGRNEQVNSFIQHSQILGYKVLVVLLLLDYIYNFLFRKENSLDIILIFLISISVSTIYLAKNKTYTTKWNDTIATISVVGLIMFTVILFIFLYQHQ